MIARLIERVVYTVAIVGLCAAAWSAQAGDGTRLMMLVLHDDAERACAYGPANGLPDSKVGTIPQSLMDEAKQRGWAVISMKNDGKTIFIED